MEQIEVLKRAAAIFNSLGIDYMIVGSAASMTYGEPRMTRDLDIVADLRPEQASALCDSFPAPEFYVSKPAAMEAIKQGGQFNIIQVTTSHKIDVMIAKHDAWGRMQLTRKRNLKVMGVVPAPVAAPEDIILAKMIYYLDGRHEKHLRDIASMLRVSKDVIDIAYIERWIPQLKVNEAWQAVLSRINSVSS